MRAPKSRDTRERGSFGFFSLSLPFYPFEFLELFGPCPKKSKGKKGKKGFTG
jgi:hypothetical protein